MTLIEDIIEISEDYGTFVQQLVKMCAEDTTNEKEFLSLIEERFASLQEQCYEFLRMVEL